MAIIGPDICYLMTDTVKADVITGKRVSSLVYGLLQKLTLLGGLDLICRYSSMVNIGWKADAFGKPPGRGFMTH